MSIIVEKKSRITTVTIDRPEVKNAIDGPTANELSNAFKEFEADEESDIAILYGANGCFCSGADLKEIAKSEASHRLEMTGDGPMGPSRLILNKPVIAAISGYAVAGGMELALWCDMRVVEKNAIFGVFCRRWGVPLVDGGTVRLPRLIGQSRALDLILTGRPVYSEEALAIGLANRIVDEGCALVAAEALAKEIIKHPQTCLRNDRLRMYEQWNMNLDDALAHEFQHGLKVIESKEAFEGAKKFQNGQGRHGSFSK